MKVSIVVILPWPLPELFLLFLFLPAFCALHSKLKKRSGSRLTTEDDDLVIWDDARVADDGRRSAEKRSASLFASRIGSF